MWSTIASVVLGGGSSRLLWIFGGVLAVALLTGLAAWRGYSAGYDRADAERRAEVAELRATYADRHAEAQQMARERLEAEMSRAADLERQYLLASNTIAAQRRTITKERIRHASRNLACLFGPDWVRLYNEALGCRADSLPPAAASASAQAGTDPAADPWLLQQVTPEDVLAHVADLGTRTRQLEHQLNALIDWAEGDRDAGDD